MNTFFNRIAMGKKKIKKVKKRKSHNRIAMGRKKTKSHNSMISPLSPLRWISKELFSKLISSVLIMVLNHISY